MVRCEEHLFAFKIYLYNSAYLTQPPPPHLLLEVLGSVGWAGGYKENHMVNHLACPEKSSPSLCLSISCKLKIPQNRPQGSVRI
jgi:hypothetical protein